MRIPAKKGGCRKQQNGKHIIIPAPKKAAEKTRHRNNNDVRDRVGGYDPRDILDRRAKGRTHIRDRDVDNRRVDQLDHRCGDDGDDDDPFSKALFCQWESVKY
jgi:hypothetical protein